MKKALIFLLVSLMILMTSCGGGNVSETTASSTTSSPSTTAAPGTETSSVTEAITTSGTTTPAPDATTTATPEETTGPAENTTVEIGTAEQLLAFMSAPDLGGNYVLTADIVLNDPINVADWANTAPAVVWTPVGSSSAPFYGTFDGQGHTITGIYVNVEKYAGFFGCISDATIKDLIIGQGYIKASGNVAGGISAYYFGFTEISGCMNLATVTAKDYVGGILGKYMLAAGCAVNISRCVNRGSIIGTIDTSAGYVGGITGICVGMNIDSCANFGDVSIGVGISTLGAIAGGIAGLMGSSQGYSESITNCFNAGTITSTQATGNAATAGIVGRMNNSGGEVSNCYNIGKICVGGTELLMAAYVAAENKDHNDYTKNLYNSGEMVVTSTGAVIKPLFTEKGLIGEVATGTGAVAKMKFDDSIWTDSASGAPILKNVDASWQTIQ